MKHDPTELRNKQLAIGATIRRLRQRAGFTSAESFADHCGLAMSSMHQWECGRNMNISSLIFICDSLKISLVEFFRIAFPEQII